MTAVQEGPTSIVVSWSPSTGANGYRTDYDSSGGHSGSETVSGGSTNTHTLTGLTNGDIYTISIAAISSSVTSAAVTADMNVGLGLLPTLQSHYFILCVCNSSRSASGKFSFSNSYYHLYLLEHSQWLSGGQL